MTEETFKAPRNRRPMDRHEFEYGSHSPPKRKKTKEDFFTFCTVIMEYTQYERYRQEDMRAQNNISPLDSSGSTASDTTFSTLSANSPDSGSLSHAEIVDSEDESWDLITCFCLKPYAGRPMIECNECNTWIHLSCAKIRKTNIPDIYVCQECKDSKYTTRKSNRIRIDNTKFTDEV